MEYTIPRMLQDSHSLSPSRSLVQVKTKFQSNCGRIIERNVKIENDKRKQIGASGKRLAIVADHQNDTLTWYVIKPIVLYPCSLSDWKDDEYQYISFNLKNWTEYTSINRLGTLFVRSWYIPSK